MGAVKDAKGASPSASTTPSTPQSGTKSPNNEAKTAAAPQRVYPWNLLGDRGAIAFTLLVIAPFAPLVITIMALAVWWLEILKPLWKHSRLSGIVTPPIHAVAQALGRRILRDPRDWPLLPYYFFLLAFAPSWFAYAAYRYYTKGFELWFLILYHVIRIGPRFRFFAHHNVLSHHEGHSHKGLFNKQYKIFNHWPMQWFLGFIYGQVATLYGVAHLKIHHRFDNNLRDVQTNWDLDRTVPLNFVIFLPRFFCHWTNMSNLVLFAARKEWDFFLRNLQGTAFYCSILYAFKYALGTQFMVLFLLYPLWESIIFLGGISYMWHCFLDPKDPHNHYVASATFLDGHDNIWNEDFHVVHHHNAGVHWSDAPAEFEKNKAKYAANKASVFRDLEQGMMLKWLLNQEWDKMAEHFVDLTGTMSHEEKKSLILERLRYCPPVDTVKTWEGLEGTMNQAATHKVE